MRVRSLILGAAACAALALPAQSSAAERAIVVLKDGADAASVAADHSRRHGAQVSHVYSHALRGYAAVLPDGKKAALQRDARVDYVEPDGVASIAAQTTPWGITAIGGTANSTLAGNGSGTFTGVTTYVLDTGVASHRDLNVVRHVNFAGGKNTDCNGHGTHVAGTVAAKDDANDVVGVAPGAAIVGVKVLGCNGSGSWSGIIAGIDWVTQNATRPAVANMSLSGGAMQSVDDAVRRSVASGILYAVAAGNDGVDACTRSPARAGAGADNGIVAVAATASTGSAPSWSNWGSCVDLWAPGVDVLSTKRGGGTTVMSGTSMASPHVAGGAALALLTSPVSPADLEARVRSDADATGALSQGRPVTLLDVRGY